MIAQAHPGTKTLNEPEIETVNHVAISDKKLGVYLIINSKGIDEKS